MGAPIHRQQVPHGVAYHQPIKVFRLEFVSAQRRDRCVASTSNAPSVAFRVALSRPTSRPSPPFSETRNASTFQSLPFSCVHIVPRYCNSTTARRCGFGMPRAASQLARRSRAMRISASSVPSVPTACASSREVTTRRCGSGMPRAAKSYQYLNSTHVFLVLELPNPSP